MADPELKKLKITRGSVQHRVTNIKKFVEKYVESQEKDVNEFKNRLELLESCWEEFNQIHGDIMGRIDEDTEKEEADTISH